MHPSPYDRRRPTFLIVDEAAPYFDDTFEKLLTRVRQFKLGVVIAFQHLEQTSQKLRSAIASSTAIKFAGGVGYTDASWLAREMRVDPHFILDQRRDSGRPPKWTQFACYVRNSSTVSIKIPFYQLEAMPCMTKEEHLGLLRRNRERVSHNGPSAPPLKRQQPSRPDPPPTSIKPDPALLSELAEARKRAEAAERALREASEPKAPPKGFKPRLVIDNNPGEPSKDSW